MRRIFHALTLLLVLAAALVPAQHASAATKSVTLAPASLTNLRGGSVGQVSSLATLDQTGTQDAPARYVAFTTPGVTYLGERTYKLPSGVSRSSVSGIQVKANYKGVTPALQTWTWFLYDATNNVWVKVGTNANATLNTWTVLTFPTTLPQRFINSTGTIRLRFQSSNATRDAKLDFEGILLTYNVASYETVNLSVNAAANRKAISPYIYGMNFAKPSFADEIDLPVRRWGGNATSRYNWQTGNTNSGMDWYFENSANGDPFTWQNENHVTWINQNVTTGSASLLTIPMIGYVAKNSTSCGFSIAKYGSQQDSDPWRSDCGNGTSTGGTPITGNDPLDTSQPADETFMQAWVAALVAQYGTAANGGVQFYALDNEPELWSETHRDVHPVDQSYDELFDASKRYALAVKTADPSALTLGYVSFGWTGYWYSWKDVQAGAQNGYTYFPDYATHGNLYQVEWYLDQMHKYEQANHLRLLDYLDLHYYPANGVGLATAGDAARQAMRLRTTRSLWDPTYRDESWIGGDDQAPDMRYVRLLPRMRNWVNTYYPGTKTAITEYNFGGLEHINGALAQADALGIFGREGLGLATLWNYPLYDDPNTPQNDDPLKYNVFETLPGAYAFRIYRNYDGSGSKFGDTSIGASSANQSKLAIYAAQRSSDNALTLVIINKTASTLSSTVSLSNFTPSGKAKIYRYSAANLNAIAHLADMTVTASGFTANFPANSITLIVLP